MWWYLDLEYLNASTHCVHTTVYFDEFQFAYSFINVFYRCVAFTIRNIHPVWSHFLWIKLGENRNWTQKLYSYFWSYSSAITVVMCIFPKRKSRSMNLVGHFFMLVHFIEMTQQSWFKIAGFKECLKSTIFFSSAINKSNFRINIQFSHSLNDEMAFLYCDFWWHTERLIWYG